MSGIFFFAVAVTGAVTAVAVAVAAAVTCYFAGKGGEVGCPFPSPVSTTKKQAPHTAWHTRRSIKMLALNTKDS